MKRYATSWVATRVENDQLKTVTRLTILYAANEAEAYGCAYKLWLEKAFEEGWSPPILSVLEIES